MWAGCVLVSVLGTVSAPPGQSAGPSAIAGPPLKIAAFNIQVFGQSKMKKEEVVVTLVQVRYNHAHTHTYTLAHTHTRTHTETHIHSRTHTQTHIRARARGHTHTHTYARTHAIMHYINQRSHLTVEHLVDSSGDDRSRP
jgi:hypothetical protein